jgi:hypothetical protein
VRKLKLSRTAPLALTLLLTACGAAGNCPPVKEWAQDYRNTLADELQAMQAEYPTAAEAVIDLMVLREQCQ